MVDDPNASQYGQDDTVRIYDGYRGLLAAEEAVIGDFAGHFRGDVLDIGIGGGRTVGPLMSRASSYVGVDYSPAMVALASRDHPSAALQVADARDLSRFGTDAFDVVMFSFNGLDSIGHDDRLRVLQQVRTALRPDGIFVFSSHNRGYHRFNLLPWQRQWRFGRTTLRKSVHALRHLSRHRRMRQQQVICADYAIINDEAHDFSLMQYYISSAAQRRQLSDAGFEWLASYDQAARRAVEDPGSCWLHYVATPSGSAG